MRILTTRSFRWCHERRVDSALKMAAMIGVLLFVGQVVMDLPATIANGDDVTAPESVSERRDDDRAVAALKELGVKLEVNEKGNVHAVDATESTLTDEGLVHFRSLPRLNVLDLTGRPITDKGIEVLSVMKGMQELYLAETQITDRALESLKSFEQLEILALQKTRVTGAGLAHLEKMKHLLVLNLGHCAIRDDDLKHLQRLPELEVLAIPATKVTNAGMDRLVPVSKLRVLNVIDCAIGDAGLEPLRTLKDLRIVHVHGTKVTQEAIKQMEVVYPSLAIFD